MPESNVSEFLVMEKAYCVGKRGPQENPSGYVPQWESELCPCNNCIDNDDDSCNQGEVEMCLHILELYHFAFVF